MRQWVTRCVCLVWAVLAFFYEVAVPDGLGGYSIGRDGRGLSFVVNDA